MMILIGSEDLSFSSGHQQITIQFPDMGFTSNESDSRQRRWTSGKSLSGDFCLLHIVNMIRKSGTLLKVLGLVATYRTKNGNHPEVTVITVRWRYSVERLMTIKSPVGKGYLGNYLGTGTRETNRSAKDTVKGIPNFLKPQFNGALMRPILGSRT